MAISAALQEALDALPEETDASIADDRAAREQEETQLAESILGSNDDDVAVTEDEKEREALGFAPKSVTKEDPAVKEVEKILEQPDEAKLRVERLKEQIAALQAKRAEASQMKRVRAEQARIAAMEAEYKQRAEALKANEESQAAKWRAALKDPVNKFGELGIPSHELYRQLTDKVLEDDTPEARLNRQIEEAVAKRLESLAPKLSKAEELEQKLALLEQEREQTRQYAQQYAQTQAERDFANLLNSEEYQDLVDYAGGVEELIEAGNQLAMTKDKQFTLKEIADELNLAFQENEKRRAARRAEREKLKSPTAPALAAKPSENSRQPTRTISNEIATQNANAATKPGLSRDEKMRKIAAEMERTSRSANQ